MPPDLFRRALVQTLLLSCFAGPGAARTRPKERVASAAPLTLDAGRILLDVDFTTPDGGTRQTLGFFNMGMGRPLLSKELYAELGVDRGAPLRYAAAGATFEIDAGRVDVAKPDFTGLSFEQMFAPRHVEAMLSPSALLDHIVVIDYPNKTLSIHSPGGAAPEGVAAPMAVNSETGLASVDVEVDGVAYPFVIDAGSGYVWMRGATLEKWLSKAPEWRRARGAIGRANYNMLDFAFEKQGTVARLPEFTIGDVKLSNVGVFGAAPLLGSFAEGVVGEVFWDNWQKSAAGPVVGWLGANVLQNFRLTLDYPNRMSYWRAPSLSLPRHRASVKTPVSRRATAGEGTLANRVRGEGDEVAPSLAKRGRVGEGDPHDLDQPGVTLVRRDEKFIIGGLVQPVRGTPLDGVAIGDELIGVGALDARGASKEQIFIALHGRPGETRLLTLRRAGVEKRVEAPVLDMS